MPATCRPEDTITENTRFLSSTMLAKRQRLVYMRNRAFTARVQGTLNHMYSLTEFQNVASIF